MGFVKWIDEVCRIFMCELHMKQMHSYFINHVVEKYSRRALLN